MIWVNFGVMAFWPWDWPRGSNYKILITIWYHSPILKERASKLPLDIIQNSLLSLSHDDTPKTVQTQKQIILNWELKWSPLHFRVLDINLVQCIRDMVYCSRLGSFLVQCIVVSARAAVFQLQTPGFYACIHLTF